MRFLVLDDDRAILTLVENLIFNLGHEAIGCLAEDEVETLRGEVHGIVIDWHLGDRTCVGVIRRLKERYPGVPIMIITGDGDLNLIQTALTLGVHDWWFKPTGIANLQSQLKSMIHDAALRRARNANPANDVRAA